MTVYDLIIAFGIYKIQKPTAKPLHNRILQYKTQQYISIGVIDSPKYLPPTDASALKNISY